MSVWARRIALVLTVATLPYVLAAALPWRDAPAIYDGVDPLLQSAILSYSAEELPLSAERWDAPIFYPTSHALAFMDPLLGQAAFVRWIPGVRGQPALLYFFAFLLTTGLAVLAVLQLGRRLGYGETAASAAAVLYVVSPFAVAHWHHLNQLPSPWLPWAILGLLRLSTGQRGGALLFCASVVGQMSFGLYGFASTAVVLSPFLFWLLWRSPLHHRLRLLASLLVLGIMLFLYSSPYIAAIEAVPGFNRSGELAGPYAVRIYDLWHGPPARLLPWPSWIPGRGVIYPGWGIVALAAFASILRWRKRQPWMVAGLVGCCLAAVLSVGRSAPLPGLTEEPTMLFGWLQDRLWPLRAIRAPYRFFQPLTLALALLAPLGAVLLYRRHRWLALALIAVAALDYAPGRLGRIRIAPDASELALIEALKKSGEPWAAFPLPCFESLEAELDARSTQWAMLSGAPLAGGSSGFVPPIHAKLRQRCCGGTNPGCIQALTDIGVRHLLLRRGELVPESIAGLSQFGEYSLVTLHSP